MTKKYLIQTSKLKAEAIYDDGKMIIQKGSQAKLDISASFPRGQRESRESLIDSGILKEEGDCFIFTKDFICNSPSQASNLITGTSSNGLLIWKNKDGKALGWIMKQEE